MNNDIRYIILFAKVCFKRIRFVWSIYYLLGFLYIIYSIFNLLFTSILITNTKCDDFSSPCGISVNLIRVAVAARVEDDVVLSERR